MNLTSSDALSTVLQKIDKFKTREIWIPFIRSEHGCYGASYWISPLTQELKCKQLLRWSNHHVDSCSICCSKPACLLRQSQHQLTVIALLSSVCKLNSDTCSSVFFVSKNRSLVVVYHCIAYCLDKPRRKHSADAVFCINCSYNKALAGSSHAVSNSSVPANVTASTAPRTFLDAQHVCIISPFC